MRWFVPLIAAFCLVSFPSKALLIDVVQVSNLSDISPATWGMGDPDVNASIDICVYTLKLLAGNDYAVTVSSVGGFVLKSGTKQIPYSLYWVDAGAGNLNSSTGTQLTNGVKLTGRANGNVLNTSCAAGSPAGPNARLRLKILQSDMSSALAGTYTGTVTILISPN